MKRFCIFVLVISIGSLITNRVNAHSGDSGMLTVKIGGIHSDSGNILLAIKKDLDFNNKDYIASDMKKSAIEGVEFEIVNLPVGEEIYLFIFHDENSNMVMDMNEQKNAC